MKFCGPFYSVIKDSSVGRLALLTNVQLPDLNYSTNVKVLMKLVEKY